MKSRQGTTKNIAKTPKVISNGQIFGDYLNLLIYCGNSYYR
uniref:Uncharacterized protein n=1 Tax=Tetranychus urticae TaxID=32264 RepID=T1KP05_TETUR